MKHSNLLVTVLSFGYETMSQSGENHRCRHLLFKTEDCTLSERVVNFKGIFQHHIKLSLNFLAHLKTPRTYFLGKLLHVKDQDHVLECFSFQLTPPRALSFSYTRRRPLGLSKVSFLGISSFFTQSNVPFLRQSKFNFIILWALLFIVWCPVCWDLSLIEVSGKD